MKNVTKQILVFSIVPHGGGSICNLPRRAQITDRIALRVSTHR